MSRLVSVLLVAFLPGCLGLEMSGAQGWESAGPFVGDWQNIDPATRGTVRLQIWTGEESILVNPWGACTPNPCNNGRFRLDPAEADDGVLSYSRKLSFKVETGEIARDGEFLTETQSSRFTDGSGRPDYASTNRFRLSGSS